MVAWDLWSITTQLQGRNPRTRVVIVPTCYYRTKSEVKWIITSLYHIIVIVNLKLFATLLTHVCTKASFVNSIDHDCIIITQGFIFGRVLSMYMKVYQPNIFSIWLLNTYAGGKPHEDITH